MWAPALTSVLGVWLTAAPDVMGYGGQARLSNQLVGVWMATFGVIAMSECLRGVQWGNLALGVWLISAPFLLDYSDERACGSLVVGIAAVSLTFVRTPVRERFGGRLDVIVETGRAVNSTGQGGKYDGRSRSSKRTGS